MKIIEKLTKIIFDKLGLWILAIFGMMGSGIIFFFQDQTNLKIVKLIESSTLLVIIEWLVLLLCLFGAYIFRSYFIHKKEISELKTFLNKHVYAKHEIHNPFFKEPSHTVEDHLSIKPFYEAVEKAAKKNQT